MDWTQKPLRLQNFIDGKWVAPSDGAYIENFNPSTGEVSGHIPDSPSADVDAAVAAGKRAFPAWAARSPQERSSVLTKIADILQERLQAFAVAESEDQGKPVHLAANMDIDRAIRNFRFFAGAILHHTEQSVENPGLINFSVRRPIGVAGLFAPWNLPLYLLTWKLAPAIAVGNSCVCKPSEFTSVTAAMLCDVLNDAGVPPGVVNMVFGTGGKTGASLSAHPDVPLISFTGGTATGELIMRSAAKYVKKLYLELGGKNPVIIFPEANLDEAVATTVRSSFTNQGEICLCGSRILVHESIHAEFMRRFVEATRALKVGDPSDPTTNMGAIVSAQHLSKINYYLDIARKEGKIVCGGDRPELPEKFQNGYWLNPTIIDGLTGDCTIQQEEIFGPVVGVTTFKTEEECIAIANSTEYGLAAVLWSEDVRRVHRVAPQLQAGNVWVNCWMVRDLRVPFGGHKKSGLGRASGEDSIDFFTERTNICIKYA